MEENRRDPLLAFRFPEFRYYLASSFIFTVAVLIQEVIIGYQLYKLTHDPFVLGLVGLAEAIPIITLSLFGGHYADKLSKKKLIIAGQILILLSSVVLYYTSLLLLDTAKAEELKYIILGVVFFIGFCRSFQWPAMGALKPFIIPRHAYENSATWASSSWQVGAIIGPGISGFLYSIFGFSNTLVFVIGLLVLSTFFVFLIKDRLIEAGDTEETMMTRIKQGIGYVWNTKPILYSISLDLFSVLFGGVVALLPIFAEDILHVGAQGFGILRGAPSVGAVIVLLILSKYPVMKHAWRTLLLSVTAFGIFTLVFAVSKNFYLSAFALLLTGGFDSISVVIRSTILQLQVPDNMRGRVNAINGIFISTSNEVGAFESGTAAKLLGTVPSVIFGGTMTLLVVVYIFLRSKDLLKMDMSK
jgi:MFS family permease